MTAAAREQAMCEEQPELDAAAPESGETNSAPALPLLLNFRANWPVRAMILRLMGAGLVASAGWLAIFGGGGDAAMLVMRAGMSVALFFVGVILLTVQNPERRPQACFDPVRRELRVLEKDRSGKPHTVLRRSYGSLGGARLTASSLQVIESDGSVLLELPVGSAPLRRMLREQLKGAVPILS